MPAVVATFASKQQIALKRKDAVAAYMKGKKRRRSLRASCGFARRLCAARTERPERAED